MGRISPSLKFPALPSDLEDKESLRNFLSNLVKTTYDILSEIINEFNGKVEVTNLLIKSSDPLRFGDEVDGSWRIVRSGNDLSFQRRESGVWVQKGVFTA